MKKSIEIIGLPIISISDGQNIGNVKSLVINHDKGSVDFLTIEHEDWQVSVKAIPFKKVVGIGEYAVTVESEGSVIDLNEIPIANQLVNKKIKITNTKVMTRKGQLLGEISEYFVDENTGNILGMQLQLPNNEVILKAEYVMTYGKDIIIVKEDASLNFLEAAEQLLDSEEGPAEDAETPAENNQKDRELQELKQKQIELLLGKRVLKDIPDNMGNVIIPQGTILETDDIRKAQDEGPGVFVELSMNVEA